MTPGRNRENPTWPQAREQAKQDDEKIPIVIYLDNVTFAIKAPKMGVRRGIRPDRTPIFGTFL
jgi:hypothetical protein